MFVLLDTLHRRQKHIRGGDGLGGGRRLVSKFIQNGFRVVVETFEFPKLITFPLPHPLHSGVIKTKV